MPRSAVGTWLDLSAQGRLALQLSAAFVRTSDLADCKRCSTLVITKRGGGQPVTHVFERSFTASDGVALLRRSTLRQWPPRDTNRAPEAGLAHSAVSE